MKKLIAALFAAVLMAAGLVVATGSTASANCTPTQYSGCVSTVTKVTTPGVVPQGKKAKVCATVNARGTNATPVGRVVFKVKRNLGGYFFKSSKDLNANGKACIKTGSLGKTGGYSVVAKYKSPKGSIFINSRNGGGFDVVG
ncbi:hypothetical protein [Nocardioides dilutus]